MKIRIGGTTGGILTLVGVLAYIAFWGTAIYVAAHFIAKVW